MSVVFKISKLAEVAELNPNLTDELDDNDTVSFVPMSAVMAESASTSTGEDRRYADVRKGYTPFLNGDVLVAKITPCFENGKIAQARLGHRVGFGSTEFHVVRPRVGRADARYLLHFLRQEHIRRDGERRMTGSAGQRRVPQHFLAGLNVPLPPLPQQRRIAEILDRADALRAKRRAALVKLETLTQSIFLDMFGDPSSNPKNFHAANLGDVVDVTGGFAFKSTDYCSTGIPLVRIGEVNRGGISRDVECFLPNHFGTDYARFVIRPGDLLMSLTGTTGKEDYGNVVLISDTFEKYLLNQRVACLRPEARQLNKHYLLYFLRHPETKIKLTAKSRGIRQANISNGDVQELKIPLPPLQLQEEFSCQVLAVEKLKTPQRASLAELNAIFAALQHRAFRGDLSSTMPDIRKAQ